MVLEPLEKKELPRIPEAVRFEPKRLEVELKFPEAPKFPTPMEEWKKIRGLGEIV